MKTCPQCDSGYPDSHTTCPTHGVLLNEIRDLKPGMVIRNTYRIVRKLGQGGMGAVYLAQHTLMDEPQALKFLSSELSQDAAFSARFLREVRTLRQIRHRNVVDAGNLEPAEDGTLFFSMEFVDGPDLRAFLNSVKGTGFSPYIQTDRSNGALAPVGSLPVPLALSIARQIAEGLGAAHSKGMVHRDIKPENILMARDGNAWLPKIADFGIVATKESSTAYTKTGGTLLTMAYAAPEQWRGLPAAELDGRTDLYALGGLLYEMLTGQTAFHAENYEGWSRQHQTTPPQPPSTLRPELANWQGLDALVLRLLAKDRNDRPTNVAELLNLLDAVRLVPSDVYQETEIDEPAARLGKKTVGESSKTVSRWGIWLGLLAGVLILAAIAVWFISQRSKQPVNSAVQTPVVQLKSANPQQEQIANIKPSNSTPIVSQNQKPSQVEILKPSVQQLSIAEIEQQAEAYYKREQYAEARPLLDQACTGGSWEACEHLGNIYLGDHGVAQDISRAVALYSKACDISSAGCVNLGGMYQGGNGVVQDRPKAAILYSKACDGGSADGCYFLGMMYIIGEGIDKNEERARELLKKSCSMGNQSGCDDLKKMQ